MAPADLLARSRELLSMGEASPELLAWNGLALEQLGDDEAALGIIESCVDGPCSVGQLSWMWMPVAWTRWAPTPLT